MGLFRRKPDLLVPEELQHILEAPAVMRAVEYNNSIRLEFEGPLTYKMLSAVSEYFGTDEIDIEGSHGEGSYDMGLEVELTIYSITKNKPDHS